MRNKYIILFVAALALLIIAITTLTDDLISPYVSFKEARALKGQYVQIIGTLKKDSPVSHAEGSFTFTMIDKGGSDMPIRHAGTKPLNFEHAEQIVVLGRFDPKTESFSADKLLVKCPSKYTKEKKE